MRPKADESSLVACAPPPSPGSHPVSAARTAQQPVVLWVIALLLAVIATTLIVRTGAATPSMVFADRPMAGAGGVFAFTGQLDKNSYGLFMMDLDEKSLWVYQYLPATRKLKLVAARSFDYDRYLKDYNNESPTEREVRGLLEDQRKIREREERGGAALDDEALGITVPGLPEAGDTSRP